MSTREMLKQDLDIMPDDIIQVFQTIWMFAKKREFEEELPNAETIAAFNETDRKSFDSFDDYMNYIDEMDDEDEAI